MWVKIDDNLPDHPRFVGIDARAGWLWLLGNCHSSRYLTNGFIEEAVAAELAGRVDPQQAMISGRHPLIGTLVQRGLWKAVSDGFRIHHYLRYNPSKRKVLEERKAARERWQRSHPKSQKADRTAHTADEPSENLRAKVPVASPELILHPSRSVAVTSLEHKNRRRERNRSALQMAQDAITTATGEASVRLVSMAGERFHWTLTKTRLAEECRLAGELLEHWDETTIQRAIQQRHKLSTMRWLADFIPRMLASQEPQRIRPAILDEPDPNVKPIPDEIREQMRKLVGGMTMP